MAKNSNNFIVKSGKVIETPGNTTFKVEIDDMDGYIITATISGKMRTNNIRVMVGDKVEIHISPADLFKGRIERRVIENKTEHTVFKNKYNHKRK